MRILFVTDFYHPYSGGVELHVRTVAAALAQRGHQVAVATLPAPPGEAPRTEDGAVSVFTVQHSAERIGARFEHQDRPWAPPFPDPITVRGLRAVVQEFKPDVIHGHDWLGRSALPKIVSSNIPVVTSLHYYTRTCAKKTLWRDEQVCPGPSTINCLRCAGDHYGKARGAVVAMGLRIGTRLEDRRTDRWISVSQATADGNGVREFTNGTVIANPVPIAEPQQDIYSQTAHSQTADVPGGIPDGPFILFVGDIRPEKGVTVLAKAVAELRRTLGNDTPLVVVGERMSTMIALPERTVEVGKVPNEVVQQLWRKATVGVVPSVWPEPFGLVAIEAMAAGCPVIASDVGGLREILADGRGTLVPAGDHHALATAIDELLNDPARRSKQASLASADGARYGTAVIVDQIEEQYRLAVAARSSAEAGSGAG